MFNQSSILNDYDLREFARITMNIILEKKNIGTARNLRMLYTHSIRTQ